MAVLQKRTATLPNQPGRFRQAYRKDTEVRKERQLAGIAKAKAEGKKWGGRKLGTRISLTMEKEALIRQLHAQGQAIAVIARLVGLSRKSVCKALEPTRDVA